jgi:general stress protein 26
MAQQDAAILAQLFKAESKGKLKQDARRAVKDAGGSDELADFFHSLDDPQIETLFTTYEAMDRMGIKGKADGATVSFL